MQNKAILNLIDDYIGSEFRFLANYLDGGYEKYVSDNLDRLIYKTVFGHKRLKSTYRNLGSYQIEQKILDSCKSCVEYVKENLK